MMNDTNSPLDYVIGQETHLDGAELQTLLHLASLDAMRQAGVGGLGAEGGLILQVILLMWQREPRRRSESPYIVAACDVELEDLTGLGEEQVQKGLRQLLGFVRVDDIDSYLAGDIELSLEPLLNGGDGQLAERLERIWRITHARSLIEAVSEAEEGIECYLGQLLTRVDPQAGGRLAMLQARWRQYLAHSRFARPFEIREVQVDLCAFEDQAAELASIHDGFAGLLARADEYAALFAERHRLAPGARLQALRSGYRVLPRSLGAPKKLLIVQ